MRLIRIFARRLWSAYMGFQDHEGTLSAAGIAYCMALSFFPLLLVLVALLGWLFQWTDFGQDAQQRILGAIEQSMSPDLAQQVARMLKLVSDRASTSGPIGFVVLIISAIAIFAQLDAAFDRIFRLPTDPHEGWWHWTVRVLVTRLKALGMLMGMGGFVLAVMITSMVWSAVLQSMESKLPEGHWLDWSSNIVINLALNLVAFTSIYKFVPRARIRWPEAIRGGALAALLWEIGRQALAAYLLRLNYPSAYGVIGSFLAIMLWAYYVSLVILFGAEYVRELRDEYRERQQKELVEK